MWLVSLGAATCTMLTTPISMLLFNLVDTNIVKKYISYPACFGLGSMLSTIFSHNLFEGLLATGMDWVAGLSFIGGILTCLIISQGIVQDKHHCCENDMIKDTMCTITPCNDDILFGGEECVTNNVKGSTTIPTVFGVKHWTWPLLIGDFICNLCDGILISSAFLLCGNILGWFTTLSIITHEFMHELGDFSLLLSSGISFKRAVMTNMVIACSVYIGWFIPHLVSFYHTSSYIGYLTLYSSGMLSSIILTMFPKYLKSKSLCDTWVKLFLVVSGIGLTTISFEYFPHCEH